MGYVESLSINRPKGGTPEAIKNRRLEAQQARTRTLDRVKQGKLSMASLLVLAQVDQDIGKQRVGVAMRAFPGWGVKRTQALLTENAIDAKTTLRQIASWSHKRAHLVKRFDEPEAKQIRTSTQFPFWNHAEDPLPSQGVAQ